MRRIGTIRIALGVLAIVLLLVNPAGICAGTILSPSPSHPCCPKPVGDPAKAPCICIDRQTAVPTLPSLTEETQFVAVTPLPALAIAIPVPAVETHVFEVAPPATHTIILSIHQLLL
jgi:hypothetical protein